MSTAVKIISNNLGKSINGRAIASPKVIDETLIQMRGEAPELNLASNITLTVSLGITKALAVSKNLPLYKCIFLI